MNARLLSRLPTSPRNPLDLETIAARLRQCGGNRHRDGKGKGGDDVEDRAPAERRLDQAAGQRAQHLRDHHHRDHQADHGADALAAVEIADDGAAHHHAGGAAQRLQKTRGDQLRQGFREDAGGACQHHQAETGQQHRAASESIRQRTHDDLRTGDADHVERHRHLRDGDVAAERGGKPGQRGHQHIQRDRRDAGHRDQQQQHDPGCRDIGSCRRAGRPAHHSVH